PAYHPSIVFCESPAYTGHLLRVAMLQRLSIAFDNDRRIDVCVTRFSQQLYLRFWLRRFRHWPPTPTTSTRSTPGSALPHSTWSSARWMAASRTSTGRSHWTLTT